MAQPAQTQPLSPPPDFAADQPLPLEALRAWIQALDRGLDAVQLQTVAGDGNRPPALLPAACRRRTHLIDTLVEALWLRAQKRHHCGDYPCAVFALGSYGRRELCPHSDIDLLILHGGEAPAEPLQRWLPDFITPLWDLGLKVSQVVYAPQDLRGLFQQLLAAEIGEPAARALQKQVTSVLDGRLLTATPAGAALPALLTAERQEFLTRHGFEFARHKAREISDRLNDLHIRPWEIPTPCYLEPNLKEGPGGLRDSQAAQWINRALATVEPAAGGTAPGGGLPALAAPHARLLAARALLHRAAGRAQDRLMQGLQTDVVGRLVAQFQPEQLGAEESDRLHAGMQPLYAAMIAIHTHAEALGRRVAAGPRIARRISPRQRLDREMLDPHWTRVGAELHPSTPGTQALKGAGALTVALQGFGLAQQAHLRVAGGWLDRLPAHLATAPVGGDLDPAVADLFRRLLARREPLYPLLLPLHFAGILSAIIPEFVDITGRSQRAPLHEVTVDVHTLRVCGALEHWHLAQREEDRERVAVLAGLKRLDLLRLAALLHDIGKSRGDAGHAERGSLMAHDILTRLGYPGEDIRLVRVLVEEHLALFNLTTLDSDDRGPFERLAGRLETKAAVDQLYLLTIADAQGVAVGALPLWREDRLRAQWQALRNVVEPDRGRKRVAAAAAAAQQPAELRASLLTGLPAGGRRARQKLAAHLEAMPTRYLTRVSTAAALQHLHLIERLGRAEAAVDIQPPAPPREPAGPRAKTTTRRAAGGSERRRAAGARATPPAPVPIGGLSVVTRDRPGRFSQICAGLTGAGLNVISAEVYERADGIILDSFQVMPIPALNAGLAPEQIAPQFLLTLEHAHALLLKILHDPSCASEIMAKILAHPLMGANRGGDQAQAEAAVHLMNASHEPLTIVDVRCPDRAGLLYGLTRAIADLGLNIHFATIDTVRGMATDVFYLSETDGGNLRDAERRRNLRLLLKAVAETPAGGGG